MNRNLLRPMALFGAVALMLTATAALTLSRATLFASGIGTLKCYDTKGGIERCSVVDQPPIIVKAIVHHKRLD